MAAQMPSLILLTPEYDLPPVPFMDAKSPSLSLQGNMFAGLGFMITCQLSTLYSMVLLHMACDMWGQLFCCIDISHVKFLKFEKKNTYHTFVEYVITSVW